MKDHLGRLLAVGQQVAVTVPHYHGLTKATVIHVTPKGATVEYKNSDGRTETVNRQSYQIAIVEQVTGYLQDWTTIPNLHTDNMYSLRGTCFLDAKKRFSDNTFIRTSTIDATKFPVDSLKEGMIVKTRNSSYQLGTQFIRDTK